MATVARALDVWRQQPVWRVLQKRGMHLDHSWSASAQRYLSAYKAVVASRPDIT
jgi:glycogen synthase